MFSGPYMITEVSHSIRPGSFDTTFSGIRQATTSLPKIDNYLQSLKTTLLQSILERNNKNKQEKEKTVPKEKSANDNVKKQTSDKVDENTKQEAKNESNSQNCLPDDTKYDKFTVTNDKVSSSATYQQVVDLIASKTPTGDQKMRYAVFATMYIRSSQSGMLQSQSNNYSAVDLLQYWGPSVDEFFKTKKYYCSDSNKPYVVFDSLNQNVEFLISRYKNRVETIKSISATDIAKFIIIYGDAAIPTSDSVYTSMSSTDIQTIESRVQEAIQKFNPISGNYTNTPPPADVPAPPSYLKIINLGVFTDLQGNDYSYRNILQSNGKYIVLKIEDPNFTFDKLGSTTFLDANNQSIGYSCSGGSGPLTCTVNGKAPGLYTMVQEYYPYKPQNWDKFEIRSAPFNQ